LLTTKILPVTANYTGRHPTRVPTKRPVYGFLIRMVKCSQ